MKIIFTIFLFLSLHVYSYASDSTKTKHLFIGVGLSFGKIDGFTRYYEFQNGIYTNHSDVINTKVISVEEDLKLTDLTFSLSYNNKWSETKLSTQFFDNTKGGVRLIFTESYNLMNLLKKFKGNAVYFFGPSLQLGRTYTPTYDWMHYGGGATFRYKRISLSYIYDTKIKRIPEITRFVNTIKIDFRIGIL